MPGLERVDDVSVADWIRPRLGGAFGAVTRTVPAGFASYARVFHPATAPDGQPVSWSEVAAETGRIVHPVMQWHAVVGSSDHLSFAGALWPGQPPSRGDLAASELTRLCRVLAGHTATADRCWFGLWDGYGWLPVQTLPTVRLRLPQRDYLMLQGPVAAATELGYRPTPDWFIAHSPNLLWPEDRAWFVASEIDFDSTLVGGSAQLVAALLSDPLLEVREVGPADSLAADADLLNPVT